MGKRMSCTKLWVYTIPKRTACQHACTPNHPTFNLDHALRARRLRWAGQILRKEHEESLTTQVLTALLQHDLDTNNTERYSLLMDAPRFSNAEEAIEMAKDTHMWAKVIRELDPTLSNDPLKKKRRIGDV